MKAILKFSTGFMSLNKSIETAKALQESDPDWRYEVIGCKNGLGRIDVYDEDGELVEEGFLPV